MDPGNGTLTNDNSDLAPVTDFETPALELDFPGLDIGVAEYEEGPTGCTVFSFPAGSTMTADVRGGSPGTMMSHREGWVDAICLAGGSIYGLEAATGVSAALLARKGYDTDWMNIGIVAAAVIFDFNAYRRNRPVYPDKRLGRAAFDTRRPGVFPLGARGAGRCATVGKWLKGACRPERSGQGGAWWSGGGTRVAVSTVVNAVGGIIDRSGQAVRGHLDPVSGRRFRVGEPDAPPPGDRGNDAPGGNTTLTVVALNVAVAPRDLRQLARQVHVSMARAIEPFHTLHDGDVLYAVTTNQIDSSPRDYFDLSHVASELAWDAVLSSIPAEAP